MRAFCLAILTGMWRIVFVLSLLGTPPLQAQTRDAMSADETAVRMVALRERARAS
jgi:hypothetical protein